MYLVTIQSKSNQQILHRCACTQDELMDFIESTSDTKCLAIVEWVDTYQSLNYGDEDEK